MKANLSTQVLANLNVKRVFNNLVKDLKDKKDSFKVMIKYSHETTRNIKLDDDLHFSWRQANTMLKEAANSDNFYFEDFGFEPKNMTGIDKINRTCFIIAQYMFSENTLFDNCEVIIRMGNRIVQYEFKARLLSYIYTLACYYVKNPSKHTKFDWKWEKENDLIYVYSYNQQNISEQNSSEQSTQDNLRSSKMILFKIDNKVLDELAVLRLNDLPRNMIMGNFDYDKYFKYAKIYYESICPEDKVRAVRSFYVVLVHLKLDLPTFKGYLPAKIIDHIMSFITVHIDVALH